MAVSSVGDVITVFIHSLDRCVDARVVQKHVGSLKVGFEVEGTWYCKTVDDFSCLWKGCPVFITEVEHRGIAIYQLQKLLAFMQGRCTSDDIIDGWTCPVNGSMLRVSGTLQWNGSLNR